MKTKRLILGLTALLSGICILSGCNNNGGDTTPTCTELTDTNQLLETPLTDEASSEFDRFLADYETKDFFEPQSGVAYGKAVLAQNGVVDGDTMAFTTVNGHYIKCRLNGINTPESTANVEAWGVKASAFAKKIFASATDFCIVNDIDAYGKVDSTSSQRLMSFIWYKTKEGKWRLYNLECVEQCYSRNFLFTDSALGYLKYFTKAQEKGETCKYRVFGTADPDYKGSDNVKEVTCYYVRHHYDEIGTSYETGSSGYYLHVTGLVVGMMGDNLVIRDLYRDEEQSDDEPLECMYAYAGFGSALTSKVKVGYVVRFFCRTSTFPAGTSNIQLTDLNVNTSSEDPYRFVSYAPTNVHYKEWVGEDTTFGFDYDPIDLTDLNVNSSADLADYFGKYVKINVTIRKATYDIDEDGTTVTFDNYYRESFNSSTHVLSATTIYAWATTSMSTDAEGNVKGTPLNLRIDAATGLRYNDFEVDHTYTLKAYMARYYDNYQLQLFNFEPQYKYIEDITA